MALVTGKPIRPMMLIVNMCECHRMERQLKKPGEGIQQGTVSMKLYINLSSF